MKADEKAVSPLYEYTPGMAWNPVEKVIMERRSIRQFKKEPLPDPMIRRILEAGRFAPSAGNSQPWKFVVVKSPEILAEMEKDAVKMAKVFMWMLDPTRSPARMRFLKGFTKLMIRMRPNELHPVPFSLLMRIAEDKAPAFHHAPTLVLFLMDRRGVSNPSVDIGVCGENMALCAHSLGAGSCWLGLIKLCMYYPKWRRRFGVRYPYKCTEAMALGWPKADPDGEVKREIQLVTWFDKGLNDKPRIERQGE